MTAKPKHHPLLLEGLAQALACPSGLALFAAKSTAGLFPNTALGKAAAREALQAGWLSSVRAEPRGKTTVEIVALTAAGSAHVLDQVNPRPLLEAVQQSLTERSHQLEQLQASLRLCQHDIDTLRARVEGLANRVESSKVSAPTSTAPWEDGLASYLLSRQQSRPAEDCPLPELFQQARRVSPALSVGEFHEALRRLHSQRRIALQPWTGPLHELPEPDLALMQGHSLAYYASPTAD